MTARIWHGYTTPENAAVYENLLKTEIFPGIAAKHIPGYGKVQLLKRELTDEVEFTTIMWFDSLDSVKAFVGPDYETAYVPDKARAVLSRFDEKSVHVDLVEEIVYELG